jgi:zinc-binding alcohol dehydrogenase/oxidoreductase
MKALVLERPASKQLPVLKEVPRPTPGPGEVLLRVHAASLNYRELGALKENPTLQQVPPFVMGGDAAGVVAAVGAGVEGWQQGDRALINAGLSCGTCRHCTAGNDYYCNEFTAPGYSVKGTPGTFSEYFLIPARNLYPIPAHLDFDAASTLPIAFGTAWNIVVTQGGVKPGDKVLIHGIGGGVALFCLQIAVARGAEVIVTSSSHEKLARAQEMGAAVGINYREEDVEQRVKALTNGEGVDLVVDGIGGETLITSLKLAASYGRVVRFGSVAGPVDVPSRFLTKTLHWGHLPSQPEWEEALRFVSETKLQPLVSAVYPLEAFEQAFQHLAQQAQFGKIVLRI